MNENQSESSPSAFSETTATIREAARGVRYTLEEELRRVNGKRF
jgi:hypothetical protein